jgi:hypothetical protein
MGVAPIRNHPELTTLPGQQSARVNRVDQKATRRGEAALGLHLEAVQPLIAEDLARRLVSIQGHELVLRRFHSRRLAVAEDKLAAQSFSGVRIGGERGDRGEHQQTQTEPH